MVHNNYSKVSVSHSNSVTRPDEKPGFEGEDGSQYEG